MTVKKSAAKKVPAKKANDPKPVQWPKPTEPSKYLASGTSLESYTNYSSYGHIDVEELVQKHGSDIEISYDISNSYGDIEIDIDVRSKKKIINPNYTQMMEYYEKKVG